MPGMKKKLFFKDPKAKVAAFVIGGVLVIVVTLLFIQLLSPRNKDKPSATSRTRKDTSVGGVNNSTGGSLSNNSDKVRKLNGVGAEAEEEDASEYVDNSFAERNYQNLSNTEAGFKQKKQKSSTANIVPDQNKQLGNESTDHSQPEPEAQLPLTRLKWL